MLVNKSAIDAFHDLQPNILHTSDELLWSNFLHPKYVT